MRERGKTTKKLEVNNTFISFLNILFFYFENYGKLYIERKKGGYICMSICFFFITGLVYELGPPHIGIIQFIFKLNKQKKENKYECL